MGEEEEEREKIGEDVECEKDEKEEEGKKKKARRRRRKKGRSMRKEEEIARETRKSQPLPGNTFRLLVGLSLRDMSLLQPYNGIQHHFP